MTTGEVIEGSGRMETDDAQSATRDVGNGLRGSGRNQVNRGMETDDAQSATRNVGNELKGSGRNQVNRVAQNQGSQGE